MTSSESENQVECGLLLNVVVREGSSILKLLTGEDKSLLVWWDSLLILDLGLNILDGVGWLNLKGDSLTGESLNEDLHSSSKSQNKMESRFLLDVVVRKSSAILELLTSKDESLLIWWDSLLVLDLGLNVLNGIGWLDLEGDSLSSEGLDEDLHSTSESEDEMESGLLLDVIVGEGSAVFELLSSEDESLLIRWNSFLILNLGLYVLNCVCWLDLKSDGLSSQSLHEDLHFDFCCSSL